MKLIFGFIIGLGVGVVVTCKTKNGIDDVCSKIKKAFSFSGETK